MAVCGGTVHLLIGPRSLCEGEAVIQTQGQCDIWLSQVSPGTHLSTNSKEGRTAR